MQQLSHSGHGLQGEVQGPSSSNSTIAALLMHGYICPAWLSVRLDHAALPCQRPGRGWFRMARCAGLHLAALQLTCMLHRTACAGPKTLCAPPVQVATTATVSAACLEALRMMLAVLEEPGGRIINPVRLTLTELYCRCGMCSRAGCRPLPGRLSGWQVRPNQQAHGCAACVPPGGFQREACSQCCGCHDLHCTVMHHHAAPALVAQPLLAAGHLGQSGCATVCRTALSAWMQQEGCLKWRSLHKRCSLH